VAIVKIKKVLIVSHRSQAGELLEELQNAGIVEILNSEDTIVARDWPEFGPQVQKPRDTETITNSLSKSIEFLESYCRTKKGLLEALSPKIVVGRSQYRQVVSGKDALSILEKSEKCSSALELLGLEKEKITAHIETLVPWRELNVRLEELKDTQRTSIFTGLLPSHNIEKVTEQLTAQSAVFQTAGSPINHTPCVVICLKEKASEVLKVLRSADFEQINLEQTGGTAAQIIEKDKHALKHIQGLIEKEKTIAKELAENITELEIIADHYKNLSTRQQKQADVPVTETAVFFEGWVRENDFNNLKSIVSKYPYSEVSLIEAAKGEEAPIDIENKPLVKPFEVITRLHSMPLAIDVDPTIFLAPFFTLFFAICLGDAGYGLVTIIALALILKKIQGDKRFFLLFLFCAIGAVIFGAITGSWFGDLIDRLLTQPTPQPPPAIVVYKNKLMLFDPFAQIKFFLILCLALGYIHLLFAVFISFIHNLRLRDYITAFCDKFSWFVMLNSIVIFGLSKTGFLIPSAVGKFFGILAFVPAVSILLFSCREGGIANRLGMGFFNLFSTIFYVGDVLSYLRLMGLSMVGAGMAMAINIIAKIVLDIHIPYGIGIVLAIIILVAGHLFNLFLSLLGAFVHTLRLQYVEFFPKFFNGGGRAFQPLSNNYKYIVLKET